MEISRRQRTIKTLKSPITRLGGKGLLCKWLREFIPDHTCYVEPFAGAASLLFAKEPSRVEIINDIDHHLITFFNVLRHPRKRAQLVAELECLPYSRALWCELREQWREGLSPSDEVSQTAWWFFLNRSTFCGDQRLGGFAVPSKTGRNPAKTYRNVIEGFESITKRLRYIVIECLPYGEAVKRYDSPETFFYIDAPYIQENGKRYYNTDFIIENHYELSELLHTIKGKCMISHYDCETYNKLYSDFNRYEYQSFKGSHKSSGKAKPKTTECLWLNFEVNPAH